MDTENRDAFNVEARQINRLYPTSRVVPGMYTIHVGDIDCFCLHHYLIDVK